MAREEKTITELIEQPVQQVDRDEDLIMMVDVSDIKGIEIEDDVTLMGCDGGNCISAEELADLSGTVNYEIICGISKRVPKVLYKQGREYRFLSSFEEN